MIKKIIFFTDKAVILLIQAVFFLVPLYFSFFYKDYSVFSLDKTELFKILVNILLVLIVIKFAAGEKLAGAARLNGLYIYLPFFLILIISTLNSVEAANSLMGSYWRQQGLITYGYYLLFIVILLLAINKKSQIDKIISALLLSSLVVSLFGLGQWFGLDSIFLPNLVEVGGRAVSTFGQPVFLGNYLLLVIWLALYKFFMAKGFCGRLFFIFIFSAQLLCLVFTYTRGAWLGFMAGLLATAYVIFKNVKARKIYLTLIVAALLIGSAFIFFGENNFFASRIKSLADFGSGSAALRLKYWQAGLTAISQRPWTGYGLENQQNVILKYYQPDWSIYETINSSPDRLHNEILDLSLQGGIFLALVYLFIILYLLYSGIKILPRLDKAGGWLLTALLISIFSYQAALLTSFSTIDASPIFWGYTAFILIILRGDSQANTLNFQPRQMTKQKKAALVIFAMMVILGSIFITKKDIDRLRADYYFKQARSAYANKDYLKMINNYTRVFDYNDREPYYGWFFANDIEAALNQIDNQALKKSILIYMENYLANNQPATENYAELLKRANLLTLLGAHDNKDYFKAAEKIYYQLSQYNPFFNNTYSSWARELVYSGNCQKALVIYKIALSTLPDMESQKLNIVHRRELEAAAAEIYKNMADCHKQLGNGEAERAEYEKILKLNPYRLDMYDSLAQAYWRAGNTNKAVWHYRRGLMLSPADYHWPLSLSLLYREKKEPDKAKAYLDQAVKLAPENIDLKKYYLELNK